MPDNIDMGVFDAIADWEHHPKMIVALGYLSSLFFIFPTDNFNLLGIFMSVIIIGSLIAVVLFIPYLLTMLMLAALLLVLQAVVEAIRYSHQ